MRVALLALALVACAPPAPETDRPGSSPEAESAQAPSDAANPDTAALGTALSYGQWFFRGDGGYVATCYGGPESECAITIQCEEPTGKLTLTSLHELAPDQATTLRIVTQSQTLELPAQSANEGLPSVTAELARSAPLRDALIAALGARQQRFGVDVRGETTVFPWDETVARALNACGGS